MAPDERRALRSQSWWEGGALDLIGHRSQFRMQGYLEESFLGRPIIGILNSWSEVAGCNAHLPRSGRARQARVLRAGGFPVEVPVISLGEPIIKPTAMLYRNLMAMAVEELIRGNPLDGVVAPRRLRQDDPGEPHGSGERRRPGAHGHRRPDAQRPVPERARRRVHRLLAAARRAAGRIGSAEADWDEFESGMCRSDGHCSPMGTASTMACVTEALGMAPERQRGDPGRRLATPSRRGARRAPDHRPRSRRAPGRRTS